MLTGSSISCGIKEYYDLHPTPQADFQILQTRLLKSRKSDWGMINPMRAGIIIWSDAVTNGRGLALATLLAQRFPDDVGITREATNPNTGHKIQLFSWHVDMAKLRAYVKQHPTIKRKKPASKQAGK